MYASKTSYVLPFFLRIENYHGSPSSLSNVSTKEEVFQYFFPHIIHVLDPFNIVCQISQHFSLRSSENRSS
jgi:hypothetical protein